MTMLRRLADDSIEGAGDDVAMVLDVLERMLQDGESRQTFRACRQRPDEARDNRVWKLMCETGIAHVCYPQELGGSGASLASAVLLAETIGRHLGPDAFTACSFFAGAFLNGPNASQLAAGRALLGGDLPVIALALQDVEASAPAPRAELALEGGSRVLRGEKQRVRGAPFATAFIVTAWDGDEPVACLVPAGATGVDVTYTPLFDGTSAARLHLNGVPLRDENVLARGAACTAALTQATEWTNVAISAELLGIQTTLLEMTLEHIKTRRQFDRPLGDFQVLRHRAADMFTSREMTRVVVLEAIQMLQSDASPLHRQIIASRAKARATDSAEKIGREAIQMHGAIGFSDECDVGLFVKRARVLSPWLGGVEHHRRRFAELASVAVGEVE
ncbi:acyl-CoA dehydrogenase family protein [Bradyrhizobium sp. URHD0069]|uniref:acyl-CoA dehydrogenase family protein n=1 Tax=Bradyrhizobium sp. URHD0069 TaxID=1380355 RepID=UPI00068DF4C4|nr:acyl-CoA dehydrogenase family protein [Bradyrhizobium sp. URHD0069]